MQRSHKAILLSLAMLNSTGVAANSLVSAGEHGGIAGSSIAVSSTGEWNRLSRSDGKAVEIWTRDGDSLNKVSFYGGIAVGSPLFKERDKKNSPLPRVAAKTLLPDIPLLLEQSYRSQFRVEKMSIDTQDIGTLNGQQAIRFTYSFMRGEDGVERKGEAIATMKNNSLYMVSYEAPAIYFFGKDLDDFRRLAQTVRF